MCLVTLLSNAQNVSNGIYSSDEDVVTLLEKPGFRKIYGGTIINVNYEGSGISSTMKGAFEYACRLWEENIPTTYPLNITVKFAKLANPQCLAIVESEHSGDLDNYDKIYTKRWAMTYGLGYGGLEHLRTLEYMRDSRDALITFSSSQPFDYNINAKEVNSNKYDFVTVALQAICRAIGFTLKAYPSGSTLNKLNPNNQYTSSILTGDVDYNYKFATSGNAYIEKSSLMSDAPEGKWNLYSPTTFDNKYSLNFFEKDPNNNETIIMQPDVISRGSAVRYIGSGLQVFFSFCGWDRSVTVGDNGTYFEEASTDNVIPYQKPITLQLSKEEILFDNQDEDIDTYMDSRKEVGEAGNYILLKDGSWQKYNDISELLDNQNYARTSDGYLRLKNITVSNPGSGWGKNTYVKYMLADYLPQIPDASINSFKISDLSFDSFQRRSFASTNFESNEFIDVEIGFKNTEGCTEVLVEQTDSDYPIPYIYYVNPSSGYFTAFMNKDYPSTFKLTYLNKNGETIGEPFKVDLTHAVLLNDAFKINVRENNGMLYYEIISKDNVLKCPVSYSIASLTENSVQKMGNLSALSGFIDVSNLEKGFYVFTLMYGNEKKSVKWTRK